MCNLGVALVRGAHTEVIADSVNISCAVALHSCRCRERLELTIGCVREVNSDD